MAVEGMKSRTPLSPEDSGIDRKSRVEPRGRLVMRFVAKAARKSCLPCLSELISERAGAAGLGSLLVWIDFPCVHWPLGGPHLLGTGERAGSGVSLAGRAVTS